jgi:hypothetical protein
VARRKAVPAASAAAFRVSVTHSTICHFLPDASALCGALFLEKRAVSNRAAIAAAGVISRFIRFASLADGRYLRFEFERHENRRRAARKIPLRRVGKALLITGAPRFFETEPVLKVFFSRRGQKD